MYDEKVLHTSGVFVGAFRSSVRAFLTGGGLSDSSTGAVMIANKKR